MAWKCADPIKKTLYIYIQQNQEYTLTRTAPIFHRHWKINNPKEKRILVADLHDYLFLGSRWLSLHLLYEGCRLDGSWESYFLPQKNIDHSSHNFCTVKLCNSVRWPPNGYRHRHRSAISGHLLDGQMHQTFHELTHQVTFALIDHCIRQPVFSFIYSLFRPVWQQKTHLH